MLHPLKYAVKLENAANRTGMTTQISYGQDYEASLISKQNYQSNVMVFSPTCELKRTIHEGHYRTSFVCHFRDEHPNRRLISS